VDLDWLCPIFGPHTAQWKVLCGPVSFSLLCVYNTTTACPYFYKLKFNIFDATVFPAWWEEAVNSIDSPHPSRKAWSTINKCNVTIPGIWVRALVVTVPKPNKPLGNSEFSPYISTVCPLAGLRQSHPIESDKQVELTRQVLKTCWTALSFLDGVTFFKVGGNKSTSKKLLKIFLMWIGNCDVTIIEILLHYLYTICRSKLHHFRESNHSANVSVNHLKFK